VHEEPPAPLAHERELLDDLLLEVPREDEHDVGAGLADRVGRMDRDVGAGEEVALLVGVEVGRVVDQVRRDPAVVEQGVALGRSAVGDDAPPRASLAPTSTSSRLWEPDGADMAPEPLYEVIAFEIRWAADPGKLLVAVSSADAG